MEDDFGPIEPEVARGAPQVLEAKLAPPKPFAWQIARPRLEAKLAEVCVRQVTLLKAGPGFGKTSIAAVWAERLQTKGARVAWVSLDPDDNEPTRFFINIARVVSRACDGVGQTAVDLIEDLSLVRPKTIVSHLINGLTAAPQETFLFIDDYHAISDPEIAENLAFLLRYAPECLRLVLLTRTEPALPLSDLRAKNRLLEIDGSALGFDLNEVAAFVRAENLGPLTLAAVTHLHERTEGWPAILRILAITGARSDFGRVVDALSGSLRPVSQYLETLLGGLPAESVEFLTRVSILERLSADLCDAVVGGATSSSRLRALDVHHLLVIPVDREGRWFRFHPLLLDHLRTRLQDAPEGEVSKLHRQAAGWHADQGFWTDAIRHAFAAGDADQAAKWIKVCAMPLVQAGDLLTLLSWQRLFPEVMENQVDAKLAIAWGFALAARLEEAMALTAEATAVLESMAPEQATALRCECDAIQSVIQAILGDTDRALALAEGAMAASADAWTINSAAGVVGTCHWRRGDVRAFYAARWIPFAPEDAPRNVFVSVYRLSLTGLMEFEQLNIELAERQYREARRQTGLHAGPQSSPAAFSASLLARLRYEQGRLDEAEALIDGHLSLIAATVMLDCAFSAYLVLARTAAHRSDFERAHGVLDHGEAAGAARKWGPLLAAVLTERVRLFALEGRTHEMRACVARLEQMALDTPGQIPSAWSNVELYCNVARAIETQENGAPADAARILEGLLNDFRAGHNRFASLCIGGKLAVAQLVAHDHAAADETFRFVISEASRSGLKQPILDLGPRAGVLIHRFLQAASTPGVSASEMAFADRIMTAWRELHPQIELIVLSPEAEGALTLREQRILELIGEGSSNKEIARSLGITAETVKSHIKHIFSKLGVDRRAQAVQRGRALGYR